MTLPVNVFHVIQIFKLDGTISFKISIICITGRITEKLFSENSKYTIYLYAY